MFTWTEESMLWMQRANDKTQYFSKIKDLTEKYIKPTDRVCEIACGTGLLVAELAKIAKTVTAVDISNEAFAFMKKALTTDNFKNIEILCGDWKEVCRNKLYDVVIFSYFGAILEDFDLLKKLAARAVVAILPFETSEGRFSRTKDGHKGETVQNVCAFLNETHTPFQLTEKELEFGQPFTSLREAFEYITYYNPDMNEEKALGFLEHNLITCENELYLPKKKKIGVIFIPIS